MLSYDVINFFKYRGHRESALFGPDAEWLCFGHPIDLKFCTVIALSKTIKFEWLQENTIALSWIMTSSTVKFVVQCTKNLIGVILLRMRGRNLTKNSSKNHLLLAKLPINKVVFATFLLNQQNAIFCILFYQKIGWTPCDKNMIAAPLENLTKISPNFEVKKKLKVTKFQLSRWTRLWEALRNVMAWAKKPPP